MSTRPSAAWLQRGLCAVTLALCACGPGHAQTPTERETGQRDRTPRWHALTDARLVLSPGQVVPRGTLLMRDGVIVAAGADVPVPAGARVWPLAGRTVYAGFIDLNSSIGVPASLRTPPPQRPQWGLGSELPPPMGPRPEARPLSARGQAARNRLVRAEQDVAQQLDWKVDEVRAARELGFTAVLAAPATGVFRGQSALLVLGDAADGKSAVIASRVAQHMSFGFNAEWGNYPSSLMGSSALARQTLLDARWYRGAQRGAAGGGERVEINETLAALAPAIAGQQPVFHAAAGDADLARIAALRDEFRLRTIVQGSGHEYRRAAQLAAWKLPVVVPLAFPAAPDLGDPDSALDIPLSALQHWEQAPSNPALLDRAGVVVAITAEGLRDARREFWPRLRQAVRRGLPAERALAALTTVPAGLVNEAGRLGSLAPGRIANVVVASGDLFTDAEAVVEMTFVDGRPLPGEALSRPDPRGSWQVEGAAGESERWQVTGTRTQPKLEAAGTAAGCELSPRGASDWAWKLPCAPGADPAAQRSIVARLQGERWVGTQQLGSGPLQPWAAARTAAYAPPVSAAASAAEAADRAVAPPPATMPPGAYGLALPEQPPTLLLRNATLWTQGPAGRLEAADMLVQRGRITAVGRNLTAPAGAQVMDLSGKHVSPGLVDAHSHIAMAGGWNEGGHSVTAEVRVRDVLDPEDIGIYRQLAGGVTTSHVLHGSANTIGGQSQVIKLRWGGDAAGLVFEGAKPTIKFALGENVKQAARPGGRYPATRMGVEQVLRDAFAAAQAYRSTWRDWQADPRGRPEPRRDLQLEALVEVLERKRAVHVHSYRADEILMFARLAGELQFEVAAFQHVLEGYKVADAMAAIGAGGSTFSDWWGYKIEVADGIPDNAALMHRAGVLTSLNSDDAEMGRRLNTEAAKAVKHGRLSETEALALVTINAARQLRVESRTGSLEPGKDADFVVWSGPPLSTYSRAEQTWVDGRRYFDLAADAARRQADAAERNRLLAAVARAPRMSPQAGPRGDGPAAPPPAPQQALGAEDLGQLQWMRVAHTMHRLGVGTTTRHECVEDTQ